MRFHHIGVTAAIRRFFRAWMQAMNTLTAQQFDQPWRDEWRR